MARKPAQVTQYLKEETALVSKVIILTYPLLNAFSKVVVHSSFTDLEVKTCFMVLLLKNMSKDFWNGDIMLNVLSNDFLDK